MESYYRLFSQGEILDDLSFSCEENLIEIQKAGENWSQRIVGLNPRVGQNLELYDKANNWEGKDEGNYPKSVVKAKRTSPIETTMPPQTGNTE